MEILQSQRDGRKLIFGVYRYTHQETLADGKESWECVYRRNHRNCKARLITTENHVVERVNDHTHPPEPTKIEAEKARTAMKQRARDTEDRTREIVARGVNGLSAQAAALVPSVQTVSRDIRRQRQDDAPLLPGRNDRNFVIPYDYTVINGRPFLRCYKERYDRMFMFGSEESLTFLSQSQHWFMDGTFQTSPPQFAQLYTIHGLGGGRSVVGAYALLPNKRQYTYVEMLRKL